VVQKSSEQVRWSFPFVKISDEVDVCRSLISANIDGSLTFAGHFETGEKVRFAIGNVEAIIDRAIVMQDEINEKPSDAIFIYSCSARKLFLSKQLNYELGLLQQIAPTAGFFTYGEFFHSPHKNQLLNVTTTVVSLSESDYVISHPLGEKPAFNCSTLKSLTHLVNTTQHELDVNINFLNQYKMALDECCIVSKMNLEGKLTYVSEPFCEVAGYSREELLGQTHQMFRPNDADTTIYATLWKTLKAKQIWKGIVQGVDKKGKIHYLQNTVMPIFDEAGNTLEYICAHFDITDLILKEQLIEQHFKDELTGYGNREALFHKMRLDESAKLLILLNLVEFSEINDYLGYDVGDELLQDVAHFLVETFDGHPDAVFRINGDEFAVLLMEKDPKNFRNVRDKVKRLIHRIEKKVFTIKGYEVVVRLKCGRCGGNDRCDLHAIACRTQRGKDRA